ncbi:MAG: hypothetical protein H6Q76_858, partial [Firmicutes bacterium]|nr:hypothetical protein [Bacillota bacterium]
MGGYQTSIGQVSVTSILIFSIFVGITLAITY